MGINTKLISLYDIIPSISIFQKIANYVKKHKNKEVCLNEKRRWMFNLIYCLALEFMSKIDILAKNKIKKIFNKVRPSLVIYNYPFWLL